MTLPCNFLRSALFGGALLVGLTAWGQTAEPQPEIHRVSLDHIPGKTLSANVDFTALLAKPAVGGADPNLATNNVTVTTDPASNLQVTGVAPRPGHAESLQIEFRGDPRTATQARMCFHAIHFQGGVERTNLCADGPILSLSSVVDQAQGLLQGLVRGNSPMVRRGTRVTQTILDPSTVSDAYGTRISKRFLVFQVTVANKNQDYEFLVHDISVRLPFRLLADDDSPVAPALGNAQLVNCDGTPNGSFGCIELSSLDLSVLQGVAERGSYMDTRNLVLRALTAAGTVAAGLQGVTTFGLSYSPAVAAYNGPLLSAYKEMFPDYTISQINRLNDKAYRANKVVPKGQAGVIVIFIPQAIVMTQEEAKEYHKDPHSLIAKKSFAQIKVLVDGMFITSAEDLAPSITNVTFTQDGGAAQSDAPKMKGFILGHALSDGKLEKGSGVPSTWKIDVDGTPSDSRIDFTLTADRPIPAETWVEVTLTKGEATVRSSGQITYKPDPPTAALDIVKAKPGAIGVVVTVTGTNFVPGLTKVTPESGAPLEITELALDKTAPSSKMTFKVNVHEKAKQGHYKLTVQSPGGSATPDFEVTPN